MAQPDTPRGEQPELQGVARAFIALVIVLGTGIAGHSLWDLFSQGVRPVWFLLLGLTVAAGLATLRIPAIPISFSVSDTFSIIAALIFGPSAGALTAAVDGLVLSCRMVTTQRSWHRVLFNTAAAAIATWVAAQAFFAVSGATIDDRVGTRRLAGLVAFAVLNFALNTGIVARAFSFERRESFVRVWRQHFQRLWVTYFGGTYTAALIMVLSNVTLLELLIVIAPLPAILYALFRHALGRAGDQVDHLASLNRVYVATIEGLAGAIDAKDHVTHDHTRRVQDRAVRLARVLQVDDDLEIQAIKAAALLHDVGKIAIPEHILNKPGRLSPQEFEIMKRHAVIGADMLSGIGFPYPVVPIVRHHHEQWDGRGYPDGLAGEAIPIGARILSVVDCFDALTSDRPYRPGLSDRDALEIVADRRGNMYDPGVVDAFVALLAEERREHPEPPRRAVSAMPVDPHRAAPASTGDGDITTAFRTVEELGEAIVDSMTGRAIGEFVWTCLHGRLPASAFVMFGYDAASDSLVPVYAAGDGAAALRLMRIRVGERLSGWVAASRESILNSDGRLDFAENGAETLQSALAVPVVVNDLTVGVLTFYARGHRAFDETHRAVAYAAAYVVGRKASHLLRPAQPVGVT